MPFTVAIVGRPNVGKSTLFNRLINARHALVDDRPGVTRDRREGEAKLGGLSFRLFDTAGLDEAQAGSLEARMRRQSEAAIEAADATLFMIDARAGVTPLDAHFADAVRRAGKPVILLANKAEGGAGEAGVLEAYGLGLGEPIPVSAEHGEGLDELYERLTALHAGAERQAGSDDEETDEHPLRVAIIGRPNAGKSTLVNRLIGEERMLTGPEAGITRDAVSIDWSWRGRPLRLWDTAGMRKKARVQDKLERLSVGDALRAVRFAEVVVLLLDATQALERQDLSLADLVAREGRALVLAINKWDLVADKAATLREIEAEVDRLLPQVAGVPVVTLSATTGKGMNRLIPAVFKAYEAWNSRVPTARLNAWLSEQVERHPPPAPSGRRIRLRYMTQASARPPTFALFCSQAAALPEAYKRYLVNGLRSDFDLAGVPIRLKLRQGKNPYV